MKALILITAAAVCAAAFPPQSVPAKPAETIRFQLSVAPATRVSQSLNDRTALQDSDIYRIDTWTGRVWKLSVTKDRWHPVLERGEALEIEK